MGFYSPVLITDALQPACFTGPIAGFDGCTHEVFLPAKPVLPFADFVWWAGNLALGYTEQ